jgi:3-phenylpropionate/trans-cinnamate dioxygenase ferredoxin reductase subunit
MAADRMVVVGAGLAGGKAVEALREKGFDGEVVLIGDERHLPYERPPLSKEYLAGKSEREKVFVHSADWYADLAIDLRLGVAVTTIDRAGHRVELADGSALGYDKLLLATGSSPRTLPIPGADARGVHLLRRLDDAERIKATLTPGLRLAVIGAGWIGLEVAAAARDAGVAVTILEALDLPLLRVLGPEVALVFADLHADHGVELQFGVGVREINTLDGVATGVLLADGTEIDADNVLIAVGAAPNTGLAERAGLEVDNGILTDAALRTSDPDILAAGDVANALHPVLGKRIRVEHWANALNQPATAAATMLGVPAAYDELPYFYTDQYDLGMEYIGYAAPGDYDRIVFRGDVSKREFIAFWLHDNRILAGMAVNTWDAIDPIKALIRSAVPIDPDKLADPAQPLDA